MGCRVLVATTIWVVVHTRVQAITAPASHRGATASCSAPLRARPTKTSPTRTTLRV